nr:uncharacterized protein LOC129386337 [Dermacentor andersoni]
MAAIPQPSVVVEDAASSSRSESLAHAMPLLLPCAVLFGAVAAFFVGWTSTLILYKTNVFHRNPLRDNAFNAEAVIAYNASATLEYGRPPSGTQYQASRRNESAATLTSNEEFLPTQ